MKKLDKLNEIADEMFEKIEPSTTSWTEIVSKANMQNAKPKSRINARRVIAFACAFALIFFGGYSIIKNEREKQRQIKTVAAGPDNNAMTTQALAVSKGSIKLSDNVSKGRVGGIWASGSSANFPLIQAEGKYYRMLTSPSSLSESLLSRNIGEVSLFTDEPALVDSNINIISNIVSEGTNVYALKNMEGAAVAAKLDNTYPVFQRVSYGSNAIVGNENLLSTLGNAKPTALKLSGVGTITDSDSIDTLMHILSRASYLGASSGGNNILLLEMNNGISLQLMVDNEKLYGCGSWYCPDFFITFAELIN
ncbi:MAG: hypothetical protein GX337_08855 [Christensenellaceae bacterium]|nr:hypothetical protein [Christensenellaceae bacterium]